MLFSPDYKSRRYIYSALITYWIILLIATSLPSESLPDIEVVSDKIQHLGAYVVLSILVTAALLVQDKSIFLKKSAYIFSIVFVSVYGLIDELHQMLIPGRNCSFLDWLADFGGALIGNLIVFILYKYEKILKRGK